MSNLNEVKGMDSIIFAMSHSEFRNITMEQIHSLFDIHNVTLEEVDEEVIDKKLEVSLLIDIKGILNSKEITKFKYIYWRA